MVSDSRTPTIPNTYVNSLESPIRVSNYPDSNHGVTPVQIVTLNRPEKLNAITSGMIDDLITFFSTVDLDDRVKIIILTGAGGTFSAGIDLNADFSQEKDSLRPSEMRDPGGTLALAMFNCSKPVIVAYNGLSVGIGMTSTLAATIRIGLTMESSSSFFLPRMVGYSNATYLLTTGKRYTTDSPVLHGIFAEILPEPKDVLPRAIEIAQDIVSNVSTMAIHLNRQLIWRSPDTVEAAHLTDSPLLYDMFGGRDHLEFKRAFFEKRRPVFKDVLSENAPRTYPWWNELSIKPKIRTQNLSKGKL